MLDDNPAVFALIVASMALLVAVAALVAPFLMKGGGCNGG